MKRNYFITEYTVECRRHPAHKLKVRLSEKRAAARYFRSQGWIYQKNKGWTCPACGRDKKPCIVCKTPFLTSRYQLSCSPACAEERVKQLRQRPTAKNRAKDWAKSPEGRAKIKAWRKMKYATDPEWRRKSKESQARNREKTKADPEKLEKLRRYQMDLYERKKDDPEWMANRLAKAKARRGRQQKAKAELELANLGKKLEAKLCPPNSPLPKASTLRGSPPSPPPRSATNSRKH